ncbi:MFS transporter [Azotobacter chroococcum subsp. isscasi]|uniref:MFS transporter n=1 Tax=Azotobacter chroococcum TaxID=353 RepID=UPI00103F6D96|nr:MFS transporter [Azotobacter chroococcum]TBW11584.1 MFS transporter [Azotobacter chroococcum subsp. isscasi]
MEHAAPPDTRRRWRVRLALGWWGQLGLCLLPMLLLVALCESAAAAPAPSGLPLFGLGLLSLFVSLPLFRAYKHALIATGNALDSAAEADAWARLAACRRRALLAAGLPAWSGAAGLWFGLESVAALLLCGASLVLLLLYRLPRQLA